MRVVDVVVALVVMAGVANADDAPENVPPQAPSTPQLQPTPPPQPQRTPPPQPTPAALPPTLAPYEPPAAAVVPADEPDTPPIDGSRVVGGIAIGSFIGVAGGAIGVLVSMGIADDCHGDDDCLATAALGAVPGLTLGAATGAWLVGTGRGQTSSYLAALGGAAIGTLGAYGGSQLTDDDRLEIAMFIIAPAIGATVGATLTRRYKTVVIEPRVTATPDHAMLGIGGTF